MKPGSLTNAYIFSIFIIAMRITDVNLQQKTCVQILNDELTAVWENMNNTFTVNGKETVSSGCLTCANYTGTTNMLNFTVPVFHVLDIGFFGKYFPESASVNISLKSNCFLKVLFDDSDSNATINLYACHEGSGICQDLRPLNNFNQVTNIEDHCPQAAIYIEELDKVHYGFYFGCDKLAGSQISDASFVTLPPGICNQEGYKAVAEFQVIRANDSEADGFPVLLSCSSKEKITTGNEGANETGT